MSDQVLDLDSVWTRAIAGLGEDVVSAQQRAWLRLTKPLALVQDTVVLATPNDFAMLTPVDRDDLEEDVFDTTGTPKQWLDRPRVTYHVEKRRKVQKPQADVGLLIPEALVLDELFRSAG